MASDATVTPTATGDPPPANNPENPDQKPTENQDTKPDVLGPDGKPSLINEPPKTPDGEPPPAFDAGKLKMPDGFDPKDPLYTQFTELATKSNLPTEQAQQFVDLYRGAAEQFVTAQQDQWAQTIAGWRQQVEADPEIGGTALNTHVLPSIAKMINEIGGDKLGPEVRQALDLTGAGNHPAIVKFFSKVAKALAEGTPVQGGAANDKPAGPGPKALYPNLP